MSYPDGSPRAEVRQAAISSAFQSLVGLLRVPVPVLAGIGVVLMIGADTVQIQSFKLPRPHAALVSVLLLLAVYLACYRSAVTLLRLLMAHRVNEDPETFAAIRFGLVTDTSIHNPFSLGHGTERHGRSYSDYLGLLLIHVPILIIAVTSIWNIQAFRRSADTFLEASAVIRETHTSGYEVGDMPVEERARRVRELTTASDRRKSAAVSLLISWLHVSAGTLFVLLYGVFLFRIGQIMYVLDAGLDNLTVGMLVIPFIMLALAWPVLESITLLGLFRLARAAGAG
jgi:hypothetical protein